MAKRSAMTTRWTTHWQGAAVLASAFLLGSCCGCPGGAEPNTPAGAANAVLGSEGTSSAEAYDWRNVTLLGGGFVTGIIFNQTEKDLVYARTDIGGAYRMDAATKTWLPITDFLGPEQNNYMGVETLATDPVDPNRVYVAAGTYTQSWAGNGAILRSRDRGATWDITELEIKMGGNENGRGMGERMAVDPNKNAVVLLGTRKYGLWRTDDGGDSWKEGSFPKREEAAGIGITFVMFDKASGKAGEPTPVVYAGWADKEQSVFVSKNNGADWEPIAGQPKGMLPNHAGIDASGDLYLSYGDSPGPGDMTRGAVYRYQPKDGKWTDVTPLKNTADDKFGYGGCSVLPSATGTVLVGTLNRWGPGDDAFLTNDGGKTWRSVLKEGVHDDAGAKYLYWGREQNQDNLSKSGWLNDIDIDPFNGAHAMYVTGQGVWATETLTQAAPEKVQWTFRNLGLEETAVTDLASPPEGAPLLSTVGDLGGFRHDELDSAPKGGMFQNPIFGSGSSLDFAELKPNVVVRAGSRSHGSEATSGAISQDGGSTWTPFPTDPPGDVNGSIVVSADGSTVIWAPKNGKVVLTRDQGASWTPCAGLPDPPKLPDWAPTNFRIAADRVNPQKFYIYDAMAGSTYFSADAGNTFVESKTGLPARAEYELGPTTVEAVPGMEGHAWASTGAELYRTTDSGQTWQTLEAITGSAGVGFGKGKEGASYPAVFLIAKVSDVYGLYRSDDEGKSWIRINTATQQYGGANRIIGDPRKFGRAYIGTHGRGILVGDLQ